MVSRLSTTWAMRRSSASTRGRASATSSASCRRGSRARRRSAQSASSRGSRSGWRIDPQRPGLDARHVEQVGHQLGQPVGLLVDDAEELLARRRVQRHVGPQQRARVALDESEWRAQLVAHHGHEIRLQPIELGQAGVRRGQLATARVRHLALFLQQAAEHAQAHGERQRAAHPAANHRPRQVHREPGCRRTLEPQQNEHRPGQAPHHRRRLGQE